MTTHTPTSRPYDHDLFQATGDAIAAAEWLNHAAWHLAYGCVGYHDNLARAEKCLAGALENIRELRAKATGAGRTPQ